MHPKFKRYYRIDDKPATWYSAAFGALFALCLVFRYAIFFAMPFMISTAVIVVVTTLLGFPQPLSEIILYGVISQFLIVGVTHYNRRRRRHGSIYEMRDDHHDGGES
jgi:type III secretory pathway component EscU